MLNNIILLPIVFIIINFIKYKMYINYCTGLNMNYLFAKLIELYETCIMITIYKLIVVPFVVHYISIECLFFLWCTLQFAFFCYKVYEMNYSIKYGAILLISGYYVCYVILCIFTLKSCIIYIFCTIIADVILHIVKYRIFSTFSRTHTTNYMERRKKYIKNYTGTIPKRRHSLSHNIDGDQSYFEIANTIKTKLIIPPYKKSTKINTSELSQNSTIVHNVAILDTNNSIKN